MLDEITSTLFNTYPREIGKKRNFVKTPEEFEAKIDLLNGADEVFTNVNAVDGTIDKIFLDFDGPTALAEAQKTYTHLLSINVPCIPIASGVKGIHLHALFRPRKRDDNKITLFKTTKSLLLSALGEKNGNNELTLKSSACSSVDPHVIGDQRRLCRVPNTLRPPTNSSYCTYLPPGKAFLEMNDTDLMWYIRGTHIYPYEDYNITSGRPTFEEYIIPEVERMNVNFPRPNEDPNVKPYADNTHLQMLLPTCLYRFITVEEPRHHVRVAVSAELKNMGFSDTEILHMFSTLNWRDWNRDLTSYQLTTVKPLVYRKRKLRDLGICFECGRSCR